MLKCTVGYEIQGKQIYYHILHIVSVIQQVQWTFSSRKYICKIDNWIIIIAPHFSIINSQVSKTEYNIRVLLIRGSRVIEYCTKNTLSSKGSLYSLLEIERKNLIYKSPSMHSLGFVMFCSLDILITFTIFIGRAATQSWCCLFTKSGACGFLMQKALPYC